MRFWFSGPRIAGYRPGVSFGAEDIRAMNGGAARQGSSSSGFVYAIMDNHGRYKLGCSTDPMSRLANLQTAHADSLEIVYCVAAQRDYEHVEKTAHDILAAYRLGGEWFNCPLDSVIAAISVAASRVGSPFVTIEPKMIGTVMRLAAASPDDQPVILSGGDYVKIALKMVLYTIVSAVSATAVIIFSADRGGSTDGISWLFAAIPFASLFAAIWDTKRNKRKRMIAA